MAWSIGLAASLAAVVVWGNYYAWQLGSISSYQLFPLFGLLAFSLMWSHYVSGALRELMGLDKRVLARYFTITGWIVLVLICLHPGLLIYQRFRDGFGLPPHSYESYVAPGLGWVTLIGTASLLVFLAFEFRRWFGGRRWWHYVADASDAAMLAILYHGLRLGKQLMYGWFRGVWLFYFVTLVAVLARKYTKRYEKWSATRSSNSKSPV
ncbi:MAG TPA: hypothetical protein VII55_01460 [Candidatus Saccharimonadales bacterium]